nr:MAG TPA: tail protein [Caudoviricetes sp.]
MINIYNIDGSVLMQVPVTKEAKREEELSKSDYISLSFNAAVKVVLPVGAYIEYTYYIDDVRTVTRQFLLLEPYKPTQSSEMSWKYTPEFQHPKMALSKKIFYITTKNSQNEVIKQTNWSFVGVLSTLMGKICDFLNNDLKFGNCGWKAQTTNTLSNAINVSFADNDVLSALTSIANAVGENCEYHIDYDNEIIYFGKVVIGDTPLILAVGENVGVPSISESKENYYNAFTVFGGTRNITQTNSKGENISSSDIRLQLEAGNGSIDVDGKNYNYSIDSFSTIDLRQDKQTEPLFTKVLNFSDVFPSLDTYVYNVRGRKKYVLDSTTNQKIPLTYNADGSVATYKTFTVWYMRLAYCTTEKVNDKTPVNTTNDNGTTHYWYDFEVIDDLIIAGKNPSCSFEPNLNTNALSTPLAGRGTNGEYVGFELNYHKNSSSSHESDDVSTTKFNILAGDYEIIYQQDNNIIVPTNADEQLIPHGELLPSLKCNITVLYNIAMSDVYKTDAQTRLLNKAKAEIIRLMSDLNNYTFKSYPQVFERKNPHLQIGQNVMYNDGQGYKLNTRILKLSTNIDFDFIQEITIGNQTIKGTITQLKEDVQSIITNGNNASNGYTVAQINDIIAKYGLRYFLSKLHPDMAQKVITFMEGLKLGKEGKMGLTGEGAATLSTVVVDEVRDPKSTEQDRVIVGAQGFNLYMGKDGKSHLYIDYLTTRTKFFAASAEVRKVSYSGGTTLFSNAGSTIMKVAHVLDDAGVTVGYKCYAAADDGTTRTANWWHVGMMALCQTFNVKAGESENLANRYFWRLVVGVGQETLEDGKLYDYVILSNKRTFMGSEACVPVTSQKVIGSDGKALVFGDVMIQVTTTGEKQSLAAVFEEQEGKTTDDGNNTIASRMFFGYEPAADGGEPDVPQPYDVIVQAGDQIQWNRFGNLIKLTTSTEDGSDNGNAPAIAMYHAMGAPYKTGDTVNPYQWKTLTSLDSPLLVLKNAKNFKFFTDDNPDNIIDPVTVTYELIPSSEYIIRKPNSQTATPNDVTFTLTKRTGNVSETMKDGYLLTADYTTTDGASKSGVVINRLSDIGVSFYLLASVTVRATVKADNTTVTLTLPILSDGAKGDTGTSFKVLGYALAHAKTYAELQQITPTDGGLYLVDDTTGMEGGGKKPCVVQWKNGKYIVCDSNDGDSYKIGEILWTNTGTYWLDIGSVKGEGVVISDMSVTYAISDSATVTPTEWQSAIIAATDAKPYLWTRTTVTYKDSEGEHTTVSYAIAYKGKDGDKGTPGANGTDAVEFILKNAPLVFDTDENGVVPSSVSKTAQIQMMRSGKNIVSKVSNLFPSNSNVGCGKPTLTKQEDGIDVTISGASINKDSTLGVSVTSGYVIVYMAIGGTLYSQQIPFMVNVAKFTGTISADNKKLRTDYTELTNRVGAVETDVNGIPIKTQGELTKYTSTIEQTAREISLKVTEETVNMARNCIVGSALREYDEITPINGTENVTIMTEGVGGTNYAQCYCIGATANSWTGLYFKDVRVKPQTKYIFSVWMRMTAKPDNGSYVSIRTYNNHVTGQEVTRVVFPDSQTLHVWTLYKVTVDVPAGCLRLIIEAAVRNNGGIDLCRPMLEEGEEYQGWSLSPDDTTIEDVMQATGFDIKNGIIKATADTFEVQDNSGNVTARITEDGFFAGSVYATNGYFDGLVRNQKRIITKDNFLEYFEKVAYSGIDDAYSPIWDKIGSNFVIRSTPVGSDGEEVYLQCVLPMAYPITNPYTDGRYERAREVVGNTIIIRCENEQSIVLYGTSRTAPSNGDAISTPYTLKSGYIAYLTCKLKNVGSSLEEEEYEMVYWERAVRKALP